MGTDRHDVHIALGGGGAKGLAHVGVLQAVEDNQLIIRSIVGTSIGAIWGALLTWFLVFRKQCGEENYQRNAIDDLRRVAITFHFFKHLDIAWFRGISSGLIKGDRMERWLENMLWNTDSQRPLTFADVDFPLTIPTTNARTGEGVLCNRELTPNVTLARAVRASMSIPGLFKEATIEVSDASGATKRTPCWDGGTTGNCRFDIACRQGTGLVIASSLTYRNEPTFVGGVGQFFRLTDHSMNILLCSIESLVFENLAPHDRARILLLQPPLSGIGTFSFGVSRIRRDQAIEAARVYARERIADLMARRSGC